MILPDDSKFGQKLLEQMGWSKGKGLGANQQGSVEPIAVKQKADNKGVGYSGHDGAWIAHQDDFAAALQLLNEHHGDNSKEEKEEGDEEPAEVKVSLEQTSKNTKKRVQ